jgi:hypothetical protein
VYFGVGSVGNYCKYGNDYVRCVRGGQSGAVGNSIIGNAGIARATVTLTGTASQNITSTADGSYGFSHLANGSYTVTPTLLGYSFTLTSQSVTVNGADVTVPAFTATYIGFTLSGNAGVSGATVTLSGNSNRTALSAADGSYSFIGLDNGN